VEALGGTVDRAHPEVGIAQVSGLTDSKAQKLKGKAAQHVMRDLIVQWTDPASDFETSQGVSAMGHAADPTATFFYPCQWNMRQIDAPGAWAQDQFGDPGVKVAVLDGGVDPFHQDLAGRIDVAQSASFISEPSICDLFAPDMDTFQDFGFHGSFVSGIITTNGIDIAGVAPLAQVVGVKVLNCQGQGSFADVIAGILYAASLPDVEIINMSLGAYFPKNDQDAKGLVAAMNKAVNYAGSQGKLVVSSAGNNGVDLDHDGNFVSVPAQSGSGIAAWAGDIDGGLAGYSNHGHSGAWVGAGGGDFAPSAQVPLAGCSFPPSVHGAIASVCSSTSLFFGCGSGDLYLFGGTGTSFSAPLVAGVAALVDGKAGGSLNAGQLKTILKNTADDIGKKGADGLFSHGRVNASSAVQ
jgi:subtilisin family serine protease